jgi:hypothetical protein
MPPDLATILRAHGITVEDIAERVLGTPSPELAMFIETKIAEKGSLWPGCVAAIASLVAERVREADAKIADEEEEPAAGEMPPSIVASVLSQNTVAVERAIIAAVKATKKSIAAAIRAGGVG